MGDKFETIRKAIHRSFLPSLMEEMLLDNGPLHRLAYLPLKSADRSLTDPFESADANF
jgi:hypothetical protein